MQLAFADWMMGYGALAFVAFLIASTFGIGAPLIMMPFLMARLSPAESVMVLVPVMLVNNFMRLWVHRKAIVLPDVLKVGISAVPAAFLAAFFTGSAKPLWIRILIIGIIGFVLAQRYLFKNKAKVSPKALYVWGVPIGFISGITGTAGPPTAIAFRGRGLVLASFVGSVAVLQAVLQLVRIPGYLQSGLVDAQLISLAIVMTLCALPSVACSKILLRRLKPDQFRKYLDLLLAMIASYMIVSMV